MTIITTQSRITYAGDGITTAFPVPFEFFLNSDITAVKTAVGGGVSTLVQTVDYVMFGAGVPAGGALFKTLPLLVGETLAIFLNPPIEQESHYPANNPFPASTLENDLDRQTQISQRLNDILSRSLRAPDGDPASGTAGFLLPSSIARANTFLTFDANGNPAIAQSLPSGTLSQAVIAALLNPQTPAEAAASVTPAAQQYPFTTPIDLRRYGQIGSATPDNAALTSALAVVNGNGVIALPANFSGTNPATLPAGVSIIDYRVAGAFPTGSDLLNGGRWINIGGNPEGSVAGFHCQQWVTNPVETSSAILATNKVTGNLSAAGGAMAAGTFELDTYGTISSAGANIYQAVGGQFAIRSLGQTLALVVGVEGGGGIDRASATTNITTCVGVQGDGCTNVSSAGATIANAFGGRFIQSTAAGITNNNFALSCEGDAMWRVGDNIRVENGSGVATIAYTFTSNTLITGAAGVKWAFGNAIGINGAAPPAQPTGYGTPTGGAHQASFAAGAITLPNLAAAVAQLIIELKAYGLLGA